MTDESTIVEMQEEAVWIYAQINEEGRVVGVSQLSGEVIADHMVYISALPDPYSVLGKRYHQDTGEWEELPQEELPPPEPSFEEKILAKLDEIEVGKGLPEGEHPPEEYVALLDGIINGGGI